MTCSTFALRPAVLQDPAVLPGPRRVEDPRFVLSTNVSYNHASRVEHRLQHRVEAVHIVLRRLQERRHVQQFNLHLVRGHRICSLIKLPISDAPSWLVPAAHLLRDDGEVDLTQLMSVARAVLFSRTRVGRPSGHVH